MSATTSIVERLTATTKNVPTLALGLMLMSVLLPSAFYSYHLKDPTPSQLLVAICIGLFSSVVFLWILDAVSILRFRSEWVSKSVYGAAIVSILGTSAGVYKDAFSASKYPYEGAWIVSILNFNTNQEIASATVALAYSDRSDTYWGNSTYQPPRPEQKIGAVWIGVSDFNPSEGRILLTWYNVNGEKSVVQPQVTAQRAGKLFEGGDGRSLSVRIARPN
jgi:hypothetical protein